MSEIYVEMQRNGAYLKVTAVCARTGEEVSAMGPANDAESVKRLAIRKLQNKLSGGNPPRPSGRGTIV